MRSVLIIIFCSILHSTTFAQPTGNIEKDTAAANRLFEAALTSKKEEDQILLFSQAVQLYEAYPFHEKQIEMNSRLAYAYLPKNDSLAEQYADKAIKLVDNNLGTSTHSYLYYTYLYYVEKYNITRSDVATFYARKALEIIEIPSNEYFEIVSYLSLDIAYQADITAFEDIVDSLDYYIITNDWNKYLPLFYRTKMQLAYFKNNFEKAIVFGNECIRTNKEYQFYSNESIGPIYVEIANFYAAMNQHEKAIELVKEGIEIANLPKNSVPLASYNANLSYIYNLNKDTNKAIEYGLKALAVYEKDIQLYGSYVHILCYNIAAYYHNDLDYNNVLLYLERSRNIRVTEYTENLYATICSENGEYDKGLSVIQDALIKYSEANFKDTHIYANPSIYGNYTQELAITALLGNKADILIKKGNKQNNLKDIEKGIETAEVAQRIFMKNMEDLKGYEAAKLSLSFKNIRLNNIMLTGEYSIYTQIGDFDALFKRIEKRKGLLLLQTLLPNKLPNDIIKKEENLVNRKREFEQYLIFTTKDSVDFYQQEISKVSLELENFIKEVQVQYPKESSIYNIDYVQPKEIQEELKANELIIEYNLIEDNLYVNIISKNIKKVYCIKTTSLSDKITQLNQILQNPFLIQQANREQFIQLSHELYQVLIAPIAKELGDKTQLIIIPEGKLFYLPFEVLLASNEIKPFEELDFLIKDFDISYQYSATIYHQLKQKTAIKDKSFLAFAPVFEDGQTINSANRSLDFMVDSLYESIDNDKFISLLHTQKEVESIAKTITKNNGNANVLLKEKATKKQLQTSLNQPYQFVHIATHGLVNYQNPKLSALACYENGTEKANDLLFANEIQMQNIQADLVILSSCESGIGRLVAGEGLIALNRSFIYSGANNVMFSLWKVNDEYTSELMIDFYNFYFQNSSYTTALRKAKLKMLQDPITANPRYWAAFVLIGE